METFMHGVLWAGVAIVALYALVGFVTPTR